MSKPVLLSLICSSFNYFGCELLVQYLDCKYPLPLWGCLFIFYWSLVFNEVTFNNIIFMCFCFLFWKSLPSSSNYQKCSFIFFCKFYCFTYVCISTILEFILWMEWDKGARSLYFHVAIQSTVFIKWSFFPWCTEILFLTGNGLIIDVSLFFFLP